MARDAFRFAMFPQQRVFGLVVVIKHDLFPVHGVMTGFAFGTIFPLMLVVFFMAIVATLGRILESSFRVTSLAFRFFVLALQIKILFAVIKMDRFPVFILMTVLAFSSQTAFVLVCLFMATVAFGRRITIFFQRGMAILAKHFVFYVPPFQNISGSIVIKVGGIQFSYALIPPFVFGMTLFARFFFLQQTVITLLPVDILCDFYVAVLAKTGLRFLIIRLVALFTIALVFQMSLDKLAR